MEMQSANLSPRRTRASKKDFLPLIRRGYTFGKVLGKGSYGCVLKAKHVDQRTGRSHELACKYIDKKLAPQDFIGKFFQREIDILTQIGHPNIIQVHSILQSGSTVFIFMRWAEYGDLLDYIINFGKVNESQSNMWFSQMARAIKYLHGLQIAHRDLKCENVLISKHLNLKIADFGFSRSTINSHGKDILSETYCGSSAYASPEIIIGAPYLPTKADIWSMGIILSVMLYGSMPFNDNSIKLLHKDQMSRNMNLNQLISNTLSSECKQVIYECLTPDSEVRPGIEEVCNMKWLDERAMKEIMKLNKAS